jgi:hypothetical protein
MLTCGRFLRNGPAAFALILERIEQEHVQQWDSMSKDVYLIAAQALELDLASDEEVPEEPVQKPFVFYR